MPEQHTPATFTHWLARRAAAMIDDFAYDLPPNAASGVPLPVEAGERDGQPVAMTGFRLTLDNGTILTFRLRAVALADGRFSFERDDEIVTPAGSWSHRVGGFRLEPRAAETAAHEYGHALVRDLRRFALDARISAPVDLDRTLAALRATLDKRSADVLGLPYRLHAYTWGSGHPHTGRGLELTCRPDGWEDDLELAFGIDPADDGGVRADASIGCRFEDDESSRTLASWSERRLDPDPIRCAAQLDELLALALAELVRVIREGRDAAHARTQISGD